MSTRRSFSLSPVRPRISIWTVRLYYELLCVYAYNLCEYWIVFEIFIFIFAFIMAHKHTHTRTLNPNRFDMSKLSECWLYFSSLVFFCFLFASKKQLVTKTTEWNKVYSFAQMFKHSVDILSQFFSYTFTGSTFKSRSLNCTKSVSRKCDQMQ